MPHESQHEGYLLSDDPARLDVDAVHAYLSKDSYWAQGVAREVVERSLRHSLCLGIYTAAGEQVGLARVVTDYATFAWLCDVYVLDAHRKRGLSKAAVRMITEHPRLQSVRRIGLATRDAHGLYAQFGFAPIAHPESQMSRPNPALVKPATPAPG